jgi:hypothetical protein
VIAGISFVAGALVAWSAIALAYRLGADNARAVLENKIARVSGVTVSFHDDDCDESDGVN